VNYISIGTSGSGGTYAIAGAAMAKVSNQYNTTVNFLFETLNIYFGDLE